MALQRISFRNFNFFNQTIRFLSTSTVKCKTFRQKYRDFWTPKPRVQPPYGHFTQVGDPVLRSRAAEVPEDMLKSKEVELICKQMTDVLHRFDCVGVAAPQIGVSLRIIVMEFREALKEKFSKEVYAARKMSTLPLTVSA